MKEYYKKKYLNCKALDVDTTGKRVKIAVAETQSIDRDGDLITPTAADKTIKERGPQGSNEIWHLLDHTPNSFSALSKFSEVGRDGKYIYGISNYKDSFAWREVAWPLYDGGDFTQHSIGFTTVKAQEMSNYREIQELIWWEGSAVLWGANPNTPTMQLIKSALGIDEAKDDLISRLERVQKAFKMDKFEDESHKSLFIIELKQIQQAIKDLQKVTEPEKNTTQPIVQVELLNELKNINQTFKLR